MSYQPSRIVAVALTVPFLAGCMGARAQDTAWTFQFPRPNFVAASYDGRDFLSPSNHLGEDSAHLHHDEVHAIAAGVVRYADVASGYGRVVVIEHRLPDGELVTSIYGHMCSHPGYPLIPDGSSVQAGDRVGFVGEDAENGDGREHIHLGIRKGGYDGYFCGYSREPECPPSRYYRPTDFIRLRSGRMTVVSGPVLSTPNPQPGTTASFQTEVQNGYAYDGDFQLRLRVQRGDEAPTYGPVRTLRLKPGERGGFAFEKALGAAGEYRAVLESRPPGVAGWSETPAPDGGVKPQPFTVGGGGGNGGGNGGGTACASVLSLPARGGAAAGRTAGRGALAGSCGGGQAPEAVYRWTPRASGPWRISSCGSAFDTVLYVRTGSCDTTLDAVCNDDGPKPCKKGGSQLTFNATAGVTYYIVIDGRGSAGGAYSLAVGRP